MAEECFKELWESRLAELREFYHLAEIPMSIRVKTQAHYLDDLPACRLTQNLRRNDQEIRAAIFNSKL